MADEPEGGEHEPTPAQRIDARELSGEEERELTITVILGNDPAHLEYYDRLLRQKAGRRRGDERQAGASILHAHRWPFALKRLPVELIVRFFGGTRRLIVDRCAASRAKPLDADS
jgi:hypothetical protein